MRLVIDELPRFVGVSVFAEHLGCCRKTVYRMIDRGTLAAVAHPGPSGRRWLRIPVSELKRLKEAALSGLVDE